MGVIFVYPHTFGNVVFLKASKSPNFKLHGFHRTDIYYQNHHYHNWNTELSDSEILCQVN